MAKYFFLFDVDETLMVGKPPGPISPLLLVDLARKGHVVGVVACKFYVSISPITGEKRYIHRSTTRSIGTLLGDIIPYYVDCDIDSLSDVLVKLRLDNKCDNYYFISANMTKIREAVKNGWTPIHPNAATVFIQRLVGSK